MSEEDFDEVLLGEDEIIVDELIYKETTLPCIGLFVAVVQALFEDLACEESPRVLSECQRLKDKAWRYLNSEGFEEYCDAAGMDVAIFRTKGRKIYEMREQMGTGHNRLAAA
jgi:hypothetical protein